MTICSFRKNQIFGEINDGQITLSKIGAIAQACWEAIPEHFPDITLLDSIIMPDHIHGIIVIHNDNDLKKGAACCAYFFMTRWEKWNLF